MALMNTCPDPSNVNPLRPTQYQFSLLKLPSLTFFVQQAQVPAIQLGSVSQATNVHDIKIPGESMSYDDLTVRFVVDEDLKNWNAVYFWMFGLGYPEGHFLYKEYLSTDINSFSRTELAKGYSDGQLMIMDSQNQPKQTFHFVDMFPVQLSGLEFDSSNSDAPVAVATVTFEYTYYKLLNK